MEGSDDQPLSAKKLTITPGGMETSVLQYTIAPESKNNAFSFDTQWMRIFKLFLFLCIFKTDQSKQRQGIHTKILE